MRAYEVRIFVPQVWLVEAKHDADVLEKIGEIYKELYQKDFRDLVEEFPLPEPEFAV